MPNYIVESDPISVSPGVYWNNLDIPLPGESSLDGIVDNSQVPIRMIIKPANITTHTVEVANFTIAGQLHSNTQNAIPYDGWDGSPVFIYEWNEGSNQIGGGAAITLPAGVDKVFMYNWDEVNSYQDGTGTNGAFLGNVVVVLAYLKPNYQIPNTSTAIKLDIDGDAADYIDPNTIAEYYLKVKLDDDSNCKVIVTLPPQITDDSNPNWDIEVVQTNSLTGIIHFKLKSDYFQEPEYNATIWEIGCNWFEIRPDSGYKLSRHMLWFDQMDPSTQLKFYPDEIEYNGNNYNWMKEGDGYFHDETWGLNVSYALNPDMISAPGIPMVNLDTDASDLGWPLNPAPTNHFWSTQWNDIKVEFDGLDPEVWNDGLTSVSYRSMITNPITNQVGGSWQGETSTGGTSPNFRTIWLIDSQGGPVSQWNFDENYYEWNMAGFPYNQPGYDWVEFTGDLDPVQEYETDGITPTGDPWLANATITKGVMPSYYCPSDFDGNSVVLGLRGLGEFRPVAWSDGLGPAYPGVGQNQYTPNVTIRVRGSAVVDDNTDCGDFSVDLVSENAQIF